MVADASSGDRPITLQTMDDRYASLQPPSIIASIASMPRRWKDALRVPAPKNIDEVFTTAGPDGTTAAEHVGAAIAQAQLLSEAIRTTSYNMPQALDPAVAAAVKNVGTGPWPESAEAGLDNLVNTMEGLHAQLEQLTPHDWNKSADAGRETLSIISLAQGASRVAADRLAAVDKIVTALAR